MSLYTWFVHLFFGEGGKFLGNGIRPPQPDRTLECSKLQQDTPVAEANKEVCFHQGECYCSFLLGTP